MNNNQKRDVKLIVGFVPKCTWATPRPKLQKHQLHSLQTTLPTHPQLYHLPINHRKKITLTKEMPILTKKTAVTDLTTELIILPKAVVEGSNHEWLSLNNHQRAISCHEQWLLSKASHTLWNAHDSMKAELGFTESTKKLQIILSILCPKLGHRILVFVCLWSMFWDEVATDRLWQVDTMCSKIKESGDKVRVPAANPVG